MNNEIEKLKKRKEKRKGKMKKLRYLFLLLLLLFFLPTKNADAKTFQKVEYLRGVDGDTIYCKKNGKEFYVRMIGINTPESVAPKEYKKNTKSGKKASEYTKELLNGKKYVYLEYDKDRTDKYGRTLAYVWLCKKANTNRFKVFKKKNVGALIMQNTVCEAVYYSPNGKYKEWYERLERKLKL